MELKAIVYYVKSILLIHIITKFHEPIRVRFINLKWNVKGIQRIPDVYKDGLIINLA